MNANTCLINRCLSCILLLRLLVCGVHPLFVERRFQGAGTRLSQRAGNPSSELPCPPPPIPFWNSNCKYPPLPLEFKLKASPLAFVILKAVCDIGMDIFWNSPFVNQWTCISKIETLSGMCNISWIMFDLWFFNSFAQSIHCSNVSRWSHYSRCPSMYYWCWWRKSTETIGKPCMVTS